MKIAKTAKELGEIVDGWRKQAETVGFVPTMGNLHAGHMRFVGALRSAGATRIVSSIFVNPTQFGPNEDFATYPRTFDDDCRRLEAANVDLLFAPDVGEIYPESGRPTVEINIAGLSSELCGAFRPGHFVGVLTVVAKLLNLTRPHLAAFGEKDYQQLVMITWMVESLCFPVQIVPVATVREEDGLALSSRNQYLSQQERGIAPKLRQVLLEAGQMLESGEAIADIERAGADKLAKRSFTVDYFSVRAADDLSVVDHPHGELVVLSAVRLGKTRLIDNLRVTLGVKQ